MRNKETYVPLLSEICRVLLPYYFLAFGKRVKIVAGSGVGNLSPKANSPGDLPFFARADPAKTPTAVPSLL